MHDMTIGIGYTIQISYFLFKQLFRKIFLVLSFEVIIFHFFLINSSLFLRRIFRANYQLPTWCKVNGDKTCKDNVMGRERRRCKTKWWIGLRFRDSMEQRWKTTVERLVNTESSRRSEVISQVSRWSNNAEHGKERKGKPSPAGASPRFKLTNSLWF